MSATTTKSSRILAIDILRGITIAGMILVNNPGNWGAHICTIRTCRMERNDTHRPCFSVLYVCHGNVYLYCHEEVRLYLQQINRL